MSKILIVEDDNALNNGIALSLKQDSYVFYSAFTIKEAQSFIHSENLDLIILDINLPDGSGLMLCKEIRKTSSVPIVFLTANDMETDVVTGFSLGCDDYITKPFSLMILRARVSAILKRTEKSNLNSFKVDDFIFDFDAMKFHKNGAEIILSKTEQKLLKILVSNVGKTLTRDILVDRVWTDGAEYVDENALTVKPAKMASEITPVEAVRFTSKTITKHNKKGTNGGKIHKMAYANIFRDKKRAAIVFTSLFLGLTIFITINTLVFSLNTDNFVASYMENDFNLYNNTFGALNTNRFLKQKFDQKFIADVKQMEGITDVQTVLLQGYVLQYEAGIYDKHLQAVYDMYNATMPSQEQLETGGSLYGYIIGLDAKQIEELNKTLKSSIDIAAFLRGEIALISTDDPTLYPSDMTIKGKAVENNQDFSFKLGGFVPWLYQVNRGSDAPNIYISIEAFIKAVENPIVYKVNINSNAKFSPEILEKLKLMIRGDNDITMESKLEMQEMMESTKMMLYILGCGLSLILALIGILNFINVMFTSVTVRSVELAMLSSIGMTKKQLKNMLMLEGVGYFAISTFLIMVFGSGITFGVFKLFQQQATYAIFSYPIIPVLSALGVVFIVCICTPLVSFRINENESVVERLRKAE